MSAPRLFLLHALLAAVPVTLGDIVASTNDLEIILGQTVKATLKTTSPLPGPVTLNYTTNNGKVVNFTLEGGGPPWSIFMEGVALGHDIISFFITPSITDVSKAFVRVTVMRSSELALMSTVVGWIYFAAWSISFYPQIYENWRRKSVVGLNFDFVYLNLIGFTLYSIFNCALYWNSSVEAEYFSVHEKGLNPVQLNDIFFSLHAALITVVTLIQCCIYERGGQRVSLIARLIIGAFFCVLIVSLCITLFTSLLSWLGFLSICSYLKLVTTLIKYIPQAFMNYKRKSTVGWSIGNVVLDFTGGTLSMLQMIVNADNYDDWSSIFGDPTKFGLGLFSVLFDIFFLIQHYILYKGSRYEELPGECVADETPTNPDQSHTSDEEQSRRSPQNFSGQYGSTTTEPVTSFQNLSPQMTMDSPLSTEDTDPVKTNLGTVQQKESFVDC